jgi:hypothetical protein
MNIGKLYQVKKYFWFLYPSKEIAVAATSTPTAYATGAAAAAEAACLSKHFKCNVSHIEPNIIFCLLEKDGKYYKVLTTNGELGWFYLADWYKEDLEEVNR